MTTRYYRGAVQARSGRVIGIEGVFRSFPCGTVRALLWRQPENSWAIPALVDKPWKGFKVADDVYFFITDGTLMLNGRGNEFQFAQLTGDV